MSDDFEYCEICKDPLLDEDDVYANICNFCGDGNSVAAQCSQTKKEEFEWQE